MSTTNHPQEESTGVLPAAEPRWGLRLRRRRVLIAAAAAIAGLVLAVAGWSAASAASQGDPMPAAAEERIDDLNSPASGDVQGEPQAPDNEDDTTYEQCVAAALEALGPPEEASNPGSGGDAEAPGGDQTTPEKAGESETATEVLEVEEPHPNSPAHEWCTADCPEDELCARPREFIITRDDNVETDSIENPNPGGDPAA